MQSLQLRGALCTGDEASGGLQRLGETLQIMEPSRISAHAPVGRQTGFSWVSRSATSRSSISKIMKTRNPLPGVLAGSRGSEAAPQTGKASGAPEVRTHWGNSRWKDSVAEYNAKQNYKSQLTGSQATNSLARLRPRQPPLIPPFIIRGVDYLGMNVSRKPQKRAGSRVKICRHDVCRNGPLRLWSWTMR